MKILIVYYSETGNTEKIAKVIYEEVLKDHNVHLKKVDDVTADILNNYDLIFLGSACHSADLAAPVKKILEALPESPDFKLAGFFTHSQIFLSHGSVTQQRTILPKEGSERASELYEKWAGKCSISFEKVSREKLIEFKGYYHCVGAPSPEIEKFIHRTILPHAHEWEKYIKEARKHPTPEDIQGAKEFAQEILSTL